MNVHWIHILGWIFQVRFSITVCWNNCADWKYLPFDPTCMNSCAMWQSMASGKYELPLAASWPACWEWDWTIPADSSADERCGQRLCLPHHVFQCLHTGSLLHLANGGTPKTGEVWLVVRDQFWSHYVGNAMPTWLSGSCPRTCQIGSLHQCECQGGRRCDHQGQVACIRVARNWPCSWWLVQSPRC